MSNYEADPVRITVSEELRDIVVDNLPPKALTAARTVTVIYKPRGLGRLQLDYEPLGRLVNGKVVEVLSSDVPGSELYSPWVHYAYCRDFSVELDTAGVYYHEHAEVMDDELERVVDEESPDMTPERIGELREALAQFAVGQLEVTEFEAGHFEGRAGAQLTQPKLNSLLGVFEAI